MIIFSLIIGLSVGIIGAVFLAQKVKKVLLELEPQEIAEQLSEKTITENGVDKGILAISPDRTILLINTPVKNIFYQAGQSLDFEVGKKSVTTYMTFCLKRRLSIRRPFGLSPRI